MSSSPIRVAIIGLGNCASSLIQGIHYYRAQSNSASETFGLIHHKVGPYEAGDIDIVAAYDVDKRKVGFSVEQAIFAPPNCTAIFHKDIPASGVTVHMGCILDGVSEHMSDYDPTQTFLVADAAQPSEEDVVAQLKATKAEVMMNYLPVGSQKATEFYARCALKAGVAFVNNIPVFIASNPEWAEQFRTQGVPVIGDDIKAQLGATITHRTLVDLFVKRGVKIKRTYQLNTGGNTDFLNMKNQQRLESKKTSKTAAVTSQVPYDMDPNDVYIGPSDYVPWQKDNKLCFLRIEGELFGGVPMNLEVRLSVEDSPNSAGVAIDSIRCAKLALDRGLSGPIEAPSSYFCKHPPKQVTDTQAYHLTNAFIAGRVKASIDEAVRQMQTMDTVSA
jgi:myo-inositol-1-phosphate synthase